MDLCCCLFLVTGGEEAGGSLSTPRLQPASVDRLPLPTPATHGWQHASLLPPDWPRLALNSRRLISFTKVKGARLRGAPAPRQAAPLCCSALIGALDLASDVNQQTKCPLRMKMYEAAQRERKPTSLGRTRLTSRFGLWSIPPESNQSRAKLRLRASCTQPLQECQSPSLRELKKKKKKFRNSSSFWNPAQAAPNPHPFSAALAGG